MIKNLIILFILFLWHGFCLSEGVWFDKNRLIIEDNSISTVTVSNDSDIAYYLKPTVFYSDKQGGLTDYKNDFFFFDPPLLKIESNSRSSFKIFNRNKYHNSSVEELYYLSVILLPEQSENRIISFGVKNILKVFTRNSIKRVGDVSTALQKISVTKQGDNIMLKNNSPLWITLKKVDVGTKNIVLDNRMIPPYDSIRLYAPMDDSLKNTYVNVSVYDELGYVIPKDRPYRVHLNGI